MPSPIVFVSVIDFIARKFRGQKKESESNLRELNFAKFKFSVYLKKDLMGKLKDRIHN